MADIQINGSAALTAALANAKGGETFVLAAGDYGDLYFYAKSFASNITFKSASSTSPAHFDSVTVLNTSNITFQGLDIGRPLTSGQPDYTPMVRLADTQNIVFDSVKVHGSLDGDPSNDGRGIQASRSIGLTIKNSEFTELSNGMIIDNSSNVTVKNNNIHGMRSDGMDFASTSQVMIDGNTFRDFNPADGDHPDAIQFWNKSGTTNVRDVTIINNVVLAGTSSGSQGVFMSDNGGYAYQNVLIQNNLIFTGGQWNGIMVAGGDGVKVIGNTVLSPSNDSLMAWIRMDDITNGLVQNNVTDKIVNEGAHTAVLINNLSINGNAAAQALIPSLLHGANTTIADLVIAGYGYHPLTSTPSSSTSSSYANAGSLFSSVLGQIYAGSASATTATNDVDRLLPTFAMSNPAAADSQDLGKLLSAAGLTSSSSSSASSASTQLVSTATTASVVGSDTMAHGSLATLLSQHTHAIA